METKSQTKFQGETRWETKRQTGSKRHSVPTVGDIMDDKVPADTGREAGKQA